MTIDQEDLERLEYKRLSDSNEIVTVSWESGGAETVNVSMDSGIAMIRDILRALA